MISATAVRRAVASIATGERLTPTQQHEAQQLLTEHECWLPLFKLLDGRVSDGNQDALEVALHKITIEIKYLGDYARVAKRAQEIVRRFGVDFAWFRLKLLPVMEDHCHLEAEVLKAVCMDFSASVDRVRCLEKICSLYEKRVPDEQLLQKYYRDLLKIDPKNILALKYYKTLHTQNYEWEEVIAALRRIMRWGSLADAYRSAQEMAAVHLYYKNDPQEALRIMQKHCADSPLDKSTILYDIHARLGNDEECVRILKKKLAAARQPAAQAQLHVSIAALQEKGGNLDAATKEYERAFEKDPSQVDVVEKIIRVLLQQDDLRAVSGWLRKLENRVTQQEQRTRLRQLRNKIKKRLTELRTSV